MFHRVKGKQVLLGSTVGAALFPLLFAAPAIGQVVADRGLKPATNTYQSYQSASINRDSGDYQPLDLLNDFYPSIEVRIEDHDNVRRRPDFEEEDLLIVASPSLGYRTNFGRHQFYAAYAGTFTFHQDINQEDAESHTVNAKLGLDLTRRWDLELFGALGDSFERRGISGSRGFDAFRDNGIDSGPESVEYVSYGADLIFGRKIGVVQAVLGYDYSSNSYDSDDLKDSTNFADSRDRSSNSLHFDVNWQFSDRTSLFARVQQTDVDYDRSDATLDSDQTDYLAGLRWKPAGSLSGTLGVGVSEKKFDDPDRDGFDSGIYYANLNYAVTPFSNISVNASRAFEEPGDENSDFYESELFGVGWSHALNNRVAFDLYAKSIDDDYNSGREDQFFDWGAELSYAWRNWMTASVYYKEIERDSNRQNIDYNDSYIGIRLRSDLRSLIGSTSKQKVEPKSFGKPKKASDYRYKR